MTNISIIRDIKLGIASNIYNIEINTSELYPKYFFRKEKMIKDFISRGCILTGSRALKCYNINGRQILNRNPRDWDFIVTKDQFLNICRDYKIYDFDISENKHYLNKSFLTFYGDYGSENSHLFPCLIELIIKDEEEQFILKDGIKFALLQDIIESKLDMINDKKLHYHIKDKYKKDINNIIVNIN